MPPRSTPTASLALLMAVLDARHSFVGAGNFLRAGRVSEADVEMSLDAGQAQARLQDLEGALRPTFAALPKDAEGNLGHQAVRYVLHRLFVQRHGWYIKGLEPNSDVSSEEWVPSLLQRRLEERLGGRGANLHELASLAAALEDLAHKEVVGRMVLAYSIHRYPRTSDVDEDDLVSVLGTYYVMYLLAGNFSASSPREADLKKEAFAVKYNGWAQAETWFRQNVIAKLGGSSSFDFGTAARLASDIGKEYHALNDVECRELKTTMRGLEGRRAGRVRLSVFYKTGLYSHWQFNEKEAYLRTLGALDESDPSQPQVILPNYLMARTNCLESSSLYALCCRNECEDLMGHLEGAIKAPEASPDAISALVAALPSDTVTAPRELPASLLGRLQQVADSNGGQVPLHGRLFAQWMHHAYPRECPYPHETGTVNVQTPDDWIKGTGHETTKATNEEMVRQVESDTCAFGDAGSGCGESSELPWSETEELLTVRWSGRRAAAGEAEVEAASFASSGVRLAGLMALVLAGVYLLDYLSVARRFASHKKDGILGGRGVDAVVGAQRNWAAVLVFALLTLAAYALDLFDRGAFAFALCGGVALFAARCAADRLVCGPRPGAGKCCI